jgi:hypothetical protein
MRTYRMVSANTHFEEWWFKTFFYSTAKAAYIIMNLIQASFLLEAVFLYIYGSKEEIFKDIKILEEASSLVFIAHK